MKKAYLALLSLGLVFAVGTTTIVLASANYKPEEKASGNVADTIIPDQKGEGEKADVLVPTVQENQDDNEQKPFEPFVPLLTYKTQDGPVTGSGCGFTSSFSGSFSGSHIAVVQYE